MNRIVMFKELGFTLQQIGHLLQEKISAEQIRGMLRLKESEIERLLDIERSKLAQVKERIQLIEREGRMDKDQEVVIKCVEEMHMITYASPGILDDIPALFEIFDVLLDSRFRSSLYGPQTVLWNTPGNTAHTLELEVGYSVKSDTLKLPEHLNLRFLPAEKVATLLFRSDSAFLETACIDLARWIERNGYRIRSDRPGREIYVPLSGEPNTHLIEIQIPIEEGEIRL
ncbi:MerR family transcriptional regulator [Lysinibacillus sphaericus]|uniref:MerR family transcriptional regulator n=1 Tax=Lysinibacillus sphaericus TaxID=1421 RepID=UPI00343961CF